MIRSRLGTALPDLAAPKCASECSDDSHRHGPDSGGPGRGSALSAVFTHCFTCAGQSTDHSSAPRDEDLHSGERTALDNAPARPHGRHTPNGATGPAVSKISQLCVHTISMPLPHLPSPVARSDLFCTVTPMDRRGRLADGSPIRAAGWRPGQPITIAVSQHPHVVIVKESGPDKITSGGHLRLPADVRHVCMLTTGDRLFVVVAVRPATTVAVYPMPTIEMIINQGQAATFGNGGTH
jgi:hypothetical protein